MTDFQVHKLSGFGHYGDGYIEMGLWGSHSSIL